MFNNFASNSTDRLTPPGPSDGLATTSTPFDYSNTATMPGYSNPMGMYGYPGQRQQSAGYGSYGMVPHGNVGYTLAPWNPPMGSQMYYEAMKQQMMNQGRHPNQVNATTNERQNMTDYNTVNFTGAYNNMTMFSQDSCQKNWSQNQFSSPSTSIPSLDVQSSFPTPESSFASDSSSPMTAGFNSPFGFMRTPQATSLPSRTPSDDQDEPKGNSKFAEVSGRLLLLTESTKYRVTVGEMERRIGNPESLHASLLNGMLRKAKGSENANKLRKDLDDWGIHLPIGRRKTTSCTTFTSLVEEETMKAARDWHQLLLNAGGAREIARDILAVTDVQVIQQRVTVARDFFHPLLGLFTSIPENPGDIRPRTSHEESINKFSRLTHGFGHLALRFFFEFIDSIFTHLIESNMEPTNFMGNTNNFNNCSSPQDPLQQIPSYSFPEQFQNVQTSMFGSQGFASKVQYTQQPADLNQSSTSYPPFPTSLTSESESIRRNIMAEEFDEIVGRLCLLGNNERYKITVGEMARRIGSPETLHGSLLNGILRKGKNTQSGGQTLQHRLEEKGISLKAKRRKSVANTVFTALCEGEAKKLAEDFAKLISDSRASEVIGKQLQLENAGSSQQFINAVNAFRTLIAQIKVCYDRVPLAPEDQNQYSGAESERAITKFSLLTHGFGNLAAMVILEFADEICTKIPGLAESTMNSFSNDPSTQFNRLI